MYGSYGKSNNLWTYIVLILKYQLQLLKKLYIFLTRNPQTYKEKEVFRVLARVWFYFYLSNSLFTALNAQFLKPNRVASLHFKACPSFTLHEGLFQFPVRTRNSKQLFHFFSPLSHCLSLNWVFISYLMLTFVILMFIINPKMT